jgi:hypothetical protein
MTDYYEQKLVETAKPGEYTMVYVKKVLSPQVEAEIANIIAERE